MFQVKVQGRTPEKKKIKKQKTHFNEMEISSLPD